MHTELAKQSNLIKDELESIANGICERDRELNIQVGICWLKNGQDLIKAKALLQHGGFESWCSERLRYGKRTAEKLMQAAEVFGPLLESVPDSDLPPPTPVYLLSAPSVPAHIREKYAPKVVAGEKVTSEIRHALKKCRNKKLNDIQGTDEGGKTSCISELSISCGADAAIPSFIETSFMALLGSNTGALLALMEASSPGEIFNNRFEREIRNIINKSAKKTEIISNTERCIVGGPGPMRDILRAQLQPSGKIE